MKLSTYRTTVARQNQSDFADRLGKSRPTLARWESGQIIPGKEEMSRIIEVTDGQVMPNDFYE